MTTGNRSAGRWSSRTSKTDLTEDRKCPARGRSAEHPARLLRRSRWPRPAAHTRPAATTPTSSEESCWKRRRPRPLPKRQQTQPRPLPLDYGAAVESEPEEILQAAEPANADADRDVGWHRNTRVTWNAEGKNKGVRTVSDRTTRIHVSTKLTSPRAVAAGFRSLFYPAPTASSLCRIVKLPEARSTANPRDIAR